jgi:hypothetical protein
MPALSTTGGSFTNAGTVTVSSGSTFTMGGSSYNYTQTAGTTTVNGTLAGGGGQPGPEWRQPVRHRHVGLRRGGYGDHHSGHSATSTGKLQVNGTYAQNSGGALDVTIGGTTAGTKFDQLNVSGTASLNGTLNITLASGYTPAVGNTFDILNASSISGTFSTVNGLAINSSEHFTVTTVSGDEIELTVVSGGAATNSVNLTQSIHAGVVHEHYGLGLYGGWGRLGTIGAPVVTRVPAPAVMARMLRMSPALWAAAPGRSSMAAMHYMLARLAPAITGRAGATGYSGADMNRTGRLGFRPMDEFGSTVPPLAPAAGGDAGVGGSMGIAPISAAAYNPMAGGQFCPMPLSFLNFGNAA